MSSKKSNGNFVTITNREVYKELCDFKDKNTEEHQKILDLINGYKAELDNLQSTDIKQWWIIGILFTMLISVLGFLFNHLNI